jgi:hypothetical protein
MVGCCSVIAGGLAEGCNINWSRMKVDPASKKRVFGTEFAEVWPRKDFQFGQQIFGKLQWQIGQNFQVALPGYL